MRPHSNPASDLKKIGKPRSNVRYLSNYRPEAVPEFTVTGAAISNSGCLTVVVTTEGDLDAVERHLSLKKVRVFNEQHNIESTGVFLHTEQRGSKLILRTARLRDWNATLVPSGSTLSIDSPRVTAPLPLTALLFAGVE